MLSDGTPWQPPVHVEDICQAIALAVEAPRDSVHNQIFNVGDDVRYDGPAFAIAGPCPSPRFRPRTAPGRPIAATPS